MTEQAPARGIWLEEAARLRALDGIAILDTPEEPTFDAIVEVAASLFEVPIALVTFVDGRRQWFKARHGIDVHETKREIAFCTHVVESGRPLVLADTMLDPRFVANPLVTGEPRIRFYAGTPLVLASGARVGSLAILDRVPRTFSEAGLGQLERLARVVVDAIEQRLVSAAARRDATRSEARMDVENTRRQAIFATALEGIVMVDSTGRILELNPAAERIFGRSRSEAVGQRVAETLLPPPENGGHASGRALLFGERSALGKRVEVSGYHASGRTFPMELTAVTLPETPPVFVAFVRDLTERKSLEAQLVHAQKMEAVGRLAGGIAHDFNNVLSVILSYTDLLLVEMPTDDPRREDVGEIANAGRRAAELTRQLLAFSRKQVLEPKVHVLDQLLANMENMLGKALGPSVTLTCELGTTAAKIRADAGSIEAVLMNLAINARDAIGERGSVRITTSRVTLGEGAPQPGAASSLPPGRYVKLAMTDSGCGMDRATQAKIFEPFFTTKQAKGTGLGLSMVLGIVEQSGGEVRVSSEPGNGTTFEIYLPVVEHGEPASLVPPAATGVGGAETILLVEDEEAVRNVAATILRRHGYQLLVAGNAAEALLISDRTTTPIDLLLTDIVMPHVNGVELAERLVMVRPQMKVLCMSGFTESHLVQRVAERRFGLLQKPLTGEILTRRVRAALDEA